MPVKKVLICPLDWGLGHATRDVEIIDQLIKAGFDVVIGADKTSLLFLQEYFPQLAHIVIPSTKITYPRRVPMAVKMIFSAPKILRGIYDEHQLLKKIIQEHQINVVISDNRYGLWNKKVKSIFITHQLWIKSPKKLRFFEPFINHINHWFIKKYDECWVPDFKEEQSIAGELSHPEKLPKNVKYVGILSRFKNLSGFEKPKQSEEKFDILVVLSGPEPQRSLLEEKLIAQIVKTDYKTLIVQGKPGQTHKSTSKNIHFVNHLRSLDLKTFINYTPVIICRSGYSSIMDLVVLNKTAILIPTPGQTEQEYLAEYLSSRKWFYATKQNEFELEKSINELAKTKISCKFEKSELLKNALP